MGLFQKKIDIQQITYKLAKSLKTQRLNWFEACLEIIKKLDMENDRYHESTLTGEVDLIIKSFQLVHVLAFINMQKYLSEKEIKDFTQQLCIAVFGTDLEDAFPFIKRYDELKTEKQGEQFKEQFSIFSEDVALSITGSPKGMIFASGLDLIVFDFYLRNLKLAAITFGDMETAEKIWQKPKNA